jgi:hypothetical protein
MPKKPKADPMVWTKDLPFRVEDYSRSVGDIVFLEESFHAYRGIYHDQVMRRIVDTTIIGKYIADGKASMHEGFIYGQPRDIMVNWQGHAFAQIDSLRHLMLELDIDATPEAIRLIGLYRPWSKKEEATLAEKLGKKAAKVKDAASDTAKPVGKGGKVAGAKGKGNPEALAKARAARAESGPDVRKIKIVNKENPYRAESNRFNAFAALTGAKTVQEYVDAGGAKKYLSRWVEEGRITLS